MEGTADVEFGGFPPNLGSVQSSTRNRTSDLGYRLLMFVLGPLRKGSSGTKLSEACALKCKLHPCSAGYCRGLHNYQYYQYYGSIFLVEQ